jgi:hypothetical protein
MVSQTTQDHNKAEYVEVRAYTGDAQKSYVYMGHDYSYPSAVMMSVWEQGANKPSSCVCFEYDYEKFTDFRASYEYFCCGDVCVFPQVNESNFFDRFARFGFVFFE